MSSPFTSFHLHCCIQAYYLLMFSTKQDSYTLNWHLNSVNPVKTILPRINHLQWLFPKRWSVAKMHECFLWQCEVVSSLKALHKLVDSFQLTAGHKGSLPYSHSDWIHFHKVRYSSQLPPLAMVSWDFPYADVFSKFGKGIITQNFMPALVTIQVGNHDVVSLSPGLGKVMMCS